MSEKKIPELYHSVQKRKLLIFGVLLLLLFIAAIIACGIGTVAIPPGDVLAAFGHAVLPGLIDAPATQSAEFIITGYRLPRILLAILAGISLAVAGAVMQGLLRNPLVSPFTLGLSSAASFGAAFMIVLGPVLFGAAFAGAVTIAGITFSASTILLILSAFLFGWMSVVLVYLISRTKMTSQAIMILAGVVIGYLFQAGLLALQYISNDEALRDIVTWLMGGMWGATWPAVIVLLPIVFLCFFLVERRAWDLNALSGGDDVAKNLGINVPQFRIRGLMIVSFAASACLAFTGVIGFIGLMAPHICRMIVGNDYRYLLPCSAVMGALILLVSDTAARSIFAPVEIPVGVIMYILGGLFFLYLITRGHGRYLG
ncbi:iron ABC transporter permease [Methanorbis furvi]|uniref:Cobalamin import system permease protein BtuC n=1 Tax=Methanorbis furvi TaxID=3028299 RepID=A0AAE4MCY7_9EURY|nr:Hemin transport system permease protein HmuU [Methanocorpusculaceae archaeon Ag1]